MLDWNPNLYLKFAKERTQPAKDLISHIEKENPRRIIDIGCGPGNSTKELHIRWRNAQIIGLDSSETMLAKAKTDYPELEWLACNANEDLSFLGKFDIVFSNAAIQWIPDQKGLLTRLLCLLNDNGVLAIQIPNTKYMPIHMAVLQTAAEDRWQQHFKNMGSNLFFEDLSFYYDILSPLVKDVELWETNYNHIISGHEGIVEWYKSTGMKPYLEKLNESEKDEFADGVLAKIRNEYQKQEDGNVLFPFRRLFFVVYK